jgi:hypothetical protein
VIEAATENLQLKQRILQQVAANVAADCLIATNTSSLSVTQLAASIEHPERFIGVHFFNPVPMMALVEIIRGLQTSDSTYAQALVVTEKLGKTPITAGNRPGFVVNRILVPMINEAIFVRQEGLASAEDIDTGMRLGCNQPIGPLALADLIGLDTLLAIMEAFRRLQRQQVPPCPAAQGNGRGRLAGAQERSRLLHLLRSTPCPRSMPQCAVPTLKSDVTGPWRCLPKRALARSACASWRPMGLTAGSLYHHFPSKQDLLYDLIEELYGAAGHPGPGPPGHGGASALSCLIAAHWQLHAERRCSFAWPSDLCCLSEEQRARLACCASVMRRVAAPDRAAGEAAGEPWWPPRMWWRRC